jgi:hypothetical protein
MRRCVVVLIVRNGRILREVIYFEKRGRTSEVSYQENISYNF